MAHEQVSRLVAGLLGDLGPRARTAGLSVLELGSYNVNGDVRGLFGPVARYVGVDWRGGPGVDHVGLFHELTWVDAFDFLISVNTFEHDPYWELSIDAGIRALKPGGELILIAAGPGYPAHEVHCAPPGPPSGEYYGNIDPLAFAERIVANNVAGILTKFTEPPDVLFHGRKRSAPHAG